MNIFRVLKQILIELQIMNQKLNVIIKLLQPRPVGLVFRLGKPERK